LNLDEEFVGLQGLTSFVGMVLEAEGPPSIFDGCYVGIFADIECSIGVNGRRCVL
jgi:hypothetical protein